jgi:hypothetical protein
MEQANVEAVVLLEIVKIGVDLGKRKHLKQGRRWEARGTLRRVLALRKLALNAQQEQEIDACTDLTTLRRWLDQAIFAESAADALR